MKAVEKTIDGEVWRAVINDEDVQSYLDAGYTISADDAPWRIEEARQAKLATIDAYDKSDAVNIFYLSGEPLWLPREDRIALRNGCEMAKAAGRAEYTIWWAGKSYAMTCDQFLQCLMQIEVYAIDCFNTTSRHKAAIQSLDSIEAIQAYDHTQGYPDALRF